MAGVVRRDGLREAVTALRDEWIRRRGGPFWVTDELSRVLDAVPDVPPDPPAATHSCMACPLEVRDIGATLHNLVGAVERGEWERVPKKLAAAKNALGTWQPIIDAHFEARDD